jgi:protein O-mannosyl-transferase
VIPRTLSPYLALSALFLVAVLCCLPALDAPFTFDEQTGIADNRALRPGSSVVSALTYRFSPDQARPIFFLSLLVDARLSGTEPGAFRRTGVVLHLTCGLLLFGLLRRAPGTDASALAGTAVFLLHPLQSESVLYIWGRSEVLSTLFLLASLTLVPLAGGPKGRRLGAWAGALVCLAFALAAKEEAVVLPLIALVWWTQAEGRLFPESLRRAAILAIPVAGFLALRSFVLGGVGRQVFARSVPDNILGQAVVTLRMLRLVLLPIGQSVDHAAAVPHLLAGSAALLACAAIIAGALDLARRFARSAGVRRIAGGVLIAATGCLLYWLVPLPDLMSERRLYLPMIGVALAASGATLSVERLRTAPSVRLLPFLPAALLVLIMAPALLARARVWADPRLLWAEAARLAPGSARPLINLGVMAAERGDAAEAGRLFDRAIVLEPDNAEARFNRGKLRLETRDAPGARDDLERAVASNPGMTRARINLAIVRINEGDLQGAESDLRAALSIDPDEPRALTNLGEVLRATGHAAEALPLYRRALDADPAYAHAAARLGVALEALGDRRGALAAYREFLARGTTSATDRSAVLEKVRTLERSLVAEPPGE